MAIGKEARPFCGVEFGVITAWSEECVSPGWLVIVTELRFELVAESTLIVAPADDVERSVTFHGYAFPAAGVVVMVKL